MNVKLLKTTLIESLTNLIENCDEQLQKEQDEWSRGYEQGYRAACEQLMGKIKALN